MLGAVEVPAEGSANLRAFVALEIDGDMRSRIAEAVTPLKSKLAGVRWVSHEQYHLTLRFLGRSSPPALESLRRALARAAEACPPAPCRVSGLGLFPERGSPHVLWLAVEVPPHILELQARSEAAAVAAGFPGEERPFRSHLTLGRWRDRGPRPELPVVDLGPTEIRNLVLFRSELRPTGAVYTPLATFPLVQRVRAEDGEDPRR